MNSSKDNDKLIDEIANLLNETAEAHHKAFAATEGDAPDWPTTNFYDWVSGNKLHSSKVLILVRPLSPPE